MQRARLAFVATMAVVAWMVSGCARLQPHYSYSNWKFVRSLGTVLETPPGFHVDRQGYAAARGLIHCYWTDFDAKEAVVPLADYDRARSQGGVPTVDGEFRAKGLTPQMATGEAAFAWHKPDTTIDGSWDDPMEEYVMIPVFRVKFNRSVWQVDAHDPSGAQHRILVVRSAPTGSQFFAGHFVRFSSLP